MCVFTRKRCCLPYINFTKKCLFQSEILTNISDSVSSHRYYSHSYARDSCAPTPQVRILFKSFPKKILAPCTQKGNAGKLQIKVRRGST